MSKVTPAALLLKFIIWSFCLNEISQDKLLFVSFVVLSMNVLLSVKPLKTAFEFVPSLTKIRAGIP